MSCPQRRGGSLRMITKPPPSPPKNEFPVAVKVESSSSAGFVDPSTTTKKMVKPDDDDVKLRCKEELLLSGSSCCWHDGLSKSEVSDDSFVEFPFKRAMQQRFPRDCTIKSLCFDKVSGTAIAFNATVVKVGINIDSAERENLYKVRFDVHDNFGLIAQPIVTILREENLHFAPYTPVWLDTSFEEHSNSGSNVVVLPKKGLIMSVLLQNEMNVLYKVQTTGNNGEVQMYEVSADRVAVRLEGSEPPTPPNPPRKFATRKVEEATGSSMKEESVKAESTTTNEGEGHELDDEKKAVPLRESEQETSSIICIDLSDDEDSTDKITPDSPPSVSPRSVKKRKVRYPPTPRPTSLEVTESNDVVERPPAKLPRHEPISSPPAVENAKKESPQLHNSSNNSKTYRKHYRKYYLPARLGVEFIQGTILGEQGSVLKHFCSYYNVHLALRGSAIDGNCGLAGNQGMDPLYLDVHAFNDESINDCLQAIEKLLCDSCDEGVRPFLLYRQTMMNRQDCIASASGIVRVNDSFKTMVKIGPVTRLERGIVSVDQARRFALSWKGSCEIHVMSRPSEKHPQVAPHLLISGSTLGSVEDFCKGLFEMPAEGPR